MIDIIDDKQQIISHISDLFELLSQTYWAKNRPKEIVYTMIQNSLCFAAFDEEKMVAFARVITDYATMYYINDVVVNREYRGCGLGKRLIERIVNDERLLGYGLLLTKDARKLYEKFGFSDCPEICLYCPPSNNN